MRVAAAAAAVAVAALRLGMASELVMMPQLALVLLLRLEHFSALASVALSALAWEETWRDFSPMQNDARSFIQNVDGMHSKTELVTIAFLYLAHITTVNCSLQVLWELCL